MIILKNFISNTLYGNGLTTTLRIFMGILFTYSGFYKVLWPNTFAKIIIKYNVIPEIVVPYVAITLPFLEITLGILLIIGFRIKASSLILISLMLLFILSISINVIRGESFDCGCFELSKFGIKEEIGISLIIRDIIFLLIFILIFNARRHLLSLDYLIERGNLSHL